MIYTLSYVQPVSQLQQKRLKKILIDQELQLADLAARTGLSLSLVEKIAAGIRPVTQRTAARIENFLGARVFSSPKAYRERVRRAGSEDIIEFDETPTGAFETLDALTNNRVSEPDLTSAHHRNS